MPSQAAQIIVTIIPIVGIVFGCTVIFFYLLLGYKQRKLMIEKGIFKKIEFDLDAFSLFTGLLLFCIGVSLVVFFAIKEGVSYGFLSGLIPLAVGASLLVFFIIRKSMNK
jgi:hypothetical protein